MQNPKPFQIKTPEGQLLNGLVNRPLGLGPYPTVVIVHGFKGFMDWGFFSPLADLLSARGFLTVRFNFSGTGVAPGEDRVSDLEAFRLQTISREKNELEFILSSLDEIAPNLVDHDRLGLFGHSRGGGNALLVSAEVSVQDDIHALVTWAAIGFYDRFDEEAKARYREEGEWIVVNGRTGQELPVALDLLEDIETHREQFDLSVAAGVRKAPWLLIHGDQDPTVPVEEAYALNQAAAEPYRLVVIEEADHVLGAQHPFAGPTPALTRALNHTQNWFIKHLR